jgi:hypothetical protein
MNWGIEPSKEKKLDMSDGEHNAIIALPSPPFFGERIYIICRGDRGMPESGDSKKTLGWINRLEIAKVLSKYFRALVACYPQISGRS